MVRTGTDTGMDRGDLQTASHRTTVPGAAEGEGVHLPVTVVTWRVPRVSSRAVEQVALDPEETDVALGAIRSVVGAQGLFYLATCQRVLFVFSRSAPESPQRFASLLDWNGRSVQADPEVLTGARALAHLVEVASSLDALVPGEPQVSEQFQQALREARRGGMLDEDLHRILQRVTRAARNVRLEAGLRGGKESLVPLTRDLVEGRLGGTEAPCVALFGTGTIARAAYRMVNEVHPGAKVLVVSRRSERAIRFAHRNGGVPMDLRSFLASSERPDLLVLAMRTKNPVLPEDHLKAYAARGPLLVLDLAVPHNAEVPDQAVPGLRLVGLDELAVLSRIQRDRDSPDLQKAHGLVVREVDRLVAREKERDLAAVLDDLEGRFHEVAKSRWEGLREKAGPIGGDEAALHKWFEQTVRALRHEAIVQVKRVHLGERGP